MAPQGGLVINKFINGHINITSAPQKRGNNRPLRRKNVEELTLKELNAEMQAITRANEIARREIEKRMMRYALLKARKEGMAKGKDVEEVTDRVEKMRTDE
ncbi:hypothetical protein N8T08_001203 [Aspergillus melleus]|uniref:Uncharacterized protein n=1 Tax=Aspergillus melleus TaxID=138277 RepID=A0ACC3ANP1_9EURO|nr:hypothetical protein N8T08_001203 [Aspergillus melleus]